MLKQVSASDALPAVVPAYKFSCESASNPGKLVKQEPSPQNLVALTIPVAL